MNSIDIIIFDEDELTKTLAQSYIKELAVLCRVEARGNISAEKLVFDDTPKILLVNIDNFTPENFKIISKLSENKNLNIAAISYDSSANLQVKAFRAGVKDFLAKPLIKSDFISAMQSIYRKYIYKSLNIKSKIYTAVSDRRGTGKSGFLLNLAGALAGVSSEKVLLLDFNNSQDRISSIMNADILHNAGYYINNLTNENAQALLADVPCYKNSSLYVIAESFTKNKPEPVTKEKFTAAAAILKQHFKYILIDKTPDISAAADAAILEASDEIFCVLLPFISTFDKIKRILDKSSRDKNIKLILNQYTPEDDNKIARIQSVLGREIFWKIPKNYTASNSAAANKSTLKEAAEGTEIADTYLELAKYLVSRT